MATTLGQHNRGRAVAVLGIFAAVGCVACSKGGDASSGAGGTSGRGGASAGSSGGANAGGSGGANAGGSGGANAGNGGANAGNGGGAAAGTGGRPAGTCTFDVKHAPSPVIGTVEIVTFSLDEPDVSAARVEFGPSGAAPTMTAPVDLREPLHRTVLIGMKGQKPYTFRVVATGGAKTCTSPEFSFTTGAATSILPKVSKPVSGAGAAKGFIVTTTGIGAMSNQPDAYIFDTDGDVVWWTYSGLSDAGEGVSRAHLSWDAKALWVMTSSTSEILRISMDGMTVTDYSNVVAMAHHDFTVLPDGGIATMLGRRGNATGHSIVEVSVDGTVTTVVADFATLYRSGFYPNAIHYYPADESYTLSDRSLGLFVKFKRNGALVWQLGGSNPLGKSFTLVGLDRWMFNHGHHLTADGHFLFFNNGGTTGDTGTPRVLEVLLDETNNTATKTWEYQGRGPASALGDVERLPNGNVLVTTSTASRIEEVDRAGTVVQSFSSNFGYVDFRTSLYGPPPR